MSDRIVEIVAWTSLALNVVVMIFGAIVLVTGG